MSISLGIFDVFANAIPGLLYLFVFNEIAKMFAVTSIDWTSINTIGQTILVVLAAYVVGHIMDFISYRLWFRLFYRRSYEERAYQAFTNVYPELRSKFDPKQTPMMLSIIRYNKPELTTEIERKKVTCVMLRNISFAFIILFAIELFLAFQNGFSITHFITGIGALIGSYASLRRADHFNMRYFAQIYQYSIIEGDSLASILKKRKRSREK